MQLNQRLIALPPYPFTKLAELRKRLSQKGLKVFDFSKGDPVEPTPQFIRDALRNSVPEVSQYPTFKGTPELRLAVSSYLKRRFGVTLDPESQVLQSNGSKEAIYNLTSVLIGPESAKRVVIAPAPGYPVMERSCLMFGVEYFPVALTAAKQYLLRLQDVSAEILKRTAMVWLNYPHNPSGACASLDYFREQYEICRRYGILLCSDECYVDMYLGDSPHPSALEVSTEGIVAFHSTSKRSGMTGYRSGFMAGDAQILKTYLSLRDAIGTETSVMIQAAATAAWLDDRHAEERRAIFRRKRDLFANFFSSEGLHLDPCEATFYLWLEPPSGLSDVAYADALAEYGLVITPGSYFGGGGERRVRVAMVPSLRETEEALILWRRAHREKFGVGM